MLILLLLALMCRPGSVLYRFSFECMINFHPWSQCFVPKRVHAILQDTHIGDVNAVMLLGFSVFIRVCANEMQCYWWRMSSVFDLYTSRITCTPFHDILLSYENTLIRSYYTWSIGWGIIGTGIGLSTNSTFLWMDNEVSSHGLKTSDTPIPRIVTFILS